jgi:hypothetical protein
VAPTTVSSPRHLASVKARCAAMYTCCCRSFRSTTGPRQHCCGCAQSGRIHRTGFPGRKHSLAASLAVGASWNP